jgi:hypothetical protein
MQISNKKKAHKIPGLDGFIGKLYCKVKEIITPILYKHLKDLKEGSLFNFAS